MPSDVNSPRAKAAVRSLSSHVTPFSSLHTLALTYEKPSPFDVCIPSCSCTCPANSAAGGAWQGLPRTYASNFGAHFSGEFLVNGSQASNLSDWRLICLQHNNAAQLTVDSTLLLNISGTSNLGAGYLQICRALQLTEVQFSVSNCGRFPVEGSKVSASSLDLACSGHVKL